MKKKVKIVMVIREKTIYIVKIENDYGEFVDVKAFHDFGEACKLANKLRQGS